MRNLIILSSLIFLFSCGDKYEMIDEKSRFNKSSGEVELLQENGEWISNVQILKDKEQRKQEQKRKKELRILKRDSNLEKLQWGTTEREKDRKIIFLNGSYSSTYSDDFTFRIKNYSEYEIEKFTFKFLYYNKEDSTLVLTLKDTLLLDIDDYRGKPGSIDNYTIKYRKRLDGEFDEWIMSIYGIKLD